jgi:spore coat polysaccharide biosynthesis protein SpsF (cytidylyltransferase family)
VQARLGSTRLPGKVLLPLAGQSVLSHVLTRCLMIDGIDDVVLACPANDATLAQVAAGLGIASFLGPEHDVLRRYAMAAHENDADVIMRITADCPLINPRVCADVLKLFNSSEVDYASNVYPRRTWQKGYDCEVFSADALERADIFAKDEYDREHVTPFIQKNCTTALLDGPGEGVNLTLDTEEDYQRLKRIIERRAA